MRLHERVRSVADAFRGLGIAWKEEANFRIEAWCGAGIVLLGVAFRISRLEWVALLFAITLVLSAETFNTALEEFCDMVKSERDPHVAKIKDLAAGAVFLASLGALAIGITVFLPHLFLS